LNDFVCGAVASGSDNNVVKGSRLACQFSGVLRVLGRQNRHIVTSGFEH
jgi:hypothetical protein